MKEKTKFYCTECGNESGKWYGQCPACGSWNTLVEAPAASKNKSGSAKASAVRLSRARPINDIDTQEEIRFSTGIGELDRVLGGGAVRGSMVLVGGAPGVGKSTLLLQICGLLEGETILYVTGEESQRQLKMRAQRLGVNGNNLYVLAETNLDRIIESIEETKPDLVIVDSVQTVYNSDLTSGPGSVSRISCSGFCIKAIAVSQTSFRLNEQILDAIPTAIP